VENNGVLHKSKFILLPLWEKVPEGRMRGAFQPQTPLTLALSHKGRGDYAIYATTPRIIGSKVF
jgi:hypothetical protein